MLLKRRKRSGEQARGTGKCKMGTKPNLNFSPTNNFISNSLLCSHFSLSCSHDSSPLPVLAELHARAREPSPIPNNKGKWKLIDARKFGYDVSVRPYVRTDFGAGSGGGTGVTGNY